MPSLIGNKPNQVPSNGDLGTLAFQDANAVNITGGIVDVSAGTAALPSLGTTGDPDTGVFFPAANTIAASTNGVERMRIDSSGNLGLGVTPSAWQSNFKVIELGFVGSGLSTNTSAKTILASNYYFNSGDKFAATGFASLYQQNNGSHYWGSSTASGTAGAAITFTSGMTLDASGSVGIRTTTPSSYNSSFNQLVVGDGSNNNGITIATGTAAIGSIAFADGITGNEAFRGYIQYLHSSDAMIYGTSGSERMRITSAGVVELAQGQIKFPATQVASADANTLDDYEEGTWTPALQFGGGTTGITYTGQTGRYTKIGNMVYAGFFIELSSKGSSTGNASIAGLPFTSGNVQANRMGTVIGFYSNFNASVVAPVIMPELSSTIATIRYSAGGVASNVTDTLYNNNSGLFGVIIYQV